MISDYVRLGRNLKSVELKLFYKYLDNIFPKKGVL